MRRQSRITAAVSSGRASVISRCLSRDPIAKAWPAPAQQFVRGEIPGRESTSGHRSPGPVRHVFLPHLLGRLRAKTIARRHFSVTSRHHWTTGHITFDFMINRSRKLWKS